MTSSRNWTRAQYCLWGWPGLTLGALATATGANAESIADFYRGKDVKVIIGYSAGGGYDVYARAVTKYMQNHIPGKPSIIPQNMTGAGSRRAANYIYNVAPKDGTVMGTAAQSLAIDQIVGETGVMYDAGKYSWIGNSIADNNVTAIWASTGITTMEEAITKGGVICGATGGTSPAVIAPQIINNLTGAKFKVIRGYPGGSVINLALERGEVNCRGSNSWSSTKSTQTDQLQNRQLNIILQWGAKKDPEISKFMGREVPNILEYAKNDLDRKALDILISGVSIGRPLFGPPDIPPDKLAALRAAFDATMKDPEFLEFAKKTHLDVNPVPGTELENIVKEALAAPPQAVARMKELLTLRDVSDVQLKSAEGAIAKLEKRNLVVTTGDGKSLSLKVNPKQTKVTVAGAKATVAELKSGMTCKFEYLGVDGGVANAECK